MKNKKKILLATLSMCLGLSAAGIILFNEGVIPSKAEYEKPSSLDCDYYFDSSNGYTSLHDINTVLVNGESVPSNYKTWGTVTCTYYNNSNHDVTSQFIQSTDKYGNSSAICLYKVTTEYPVGSVVTVSGGTVKLYNGMPEIENPVIELDYESNPNPVVPYELTSIPTSSSSTEFKEYRYMGTKKVVLHDLTLASSTYQNRQITATLPGGGSTLLFYNSISNKSDINSTFNGLAGKSGVTVTGYLTYYSGGSGSLQVLIRDANDIEYDSSKTVSYIKAEVDRDIYYYGETPSINNFTVTAYYTDSTSEVVSNAYISQNIDTTTLGEQTFTISYLHKGNVYSDQCIVEVVDDIISIEAINPVRYYALNEAFIAPTVYGYYGSDGHSVDITSSVTFSPFLNYEEIHDTIYVDYTNSGGSVVSTSYDYYISNVESVIYEDAVYEYYVGDAFITPTVIATYSCDTSLEFDVTDRCSITGFDSSTSGKRNITIKYADFDDIVYEITIKKNVTVLEIEVTSAQTSYTVNESFKLPTVIATYSDYSYEDVSNECIYNGFDSSEIGEVEVYVYFENVSTSYSITIKDGSYEGYEHYSLDYSTNTGMGTYATGNFGNFSIYEYYRAVESSGNLMSLLPKEGIYVDTLPGAIYNTSAIRDIDYIEITYSTLSSSGSNAPSIDYGEHNYLDGNEVLTYSTSMTTKQINLVNHDVNYFKVNCGDTKMNIEVIDIYYSDTTTPTGYSFNYIDANEGLYRLEPTVYNGSLNDGVSYVDVPISYDTTNKQILATKRYTYYSYQYVYEHRYELDLESIAMTDPVDVINYFQAFGCAPSNFGKQNTVNPMRDGLSLPSKSNVNNLFGDNARTVSQYSKTTGYAKAIPYYGSTPLYYEFDIALDDSYLTNNRGVGRVVAWSTGFNVYEYGYGNQPVCHFTDDHYATFQEFNNFGGFMPRFSMETNIASAIWSNPITL